MKPSRWLVTGLAVFSPLCRPVAGFGGGQEILSVTGNPARGRDVLVEKGCIACHAVRGAGGTVAPDLAVALVDKGHGGIAAAMLNHYPKVSSVVREQKTALPVLSTAAMDDLVAYLLFINFAREPGSADTGRALFNQKGCVKCHWSSTASPSIGPPLGRATLSASPTAVAQAMWNHGTQMMARMQELNVPRSTFDGHEMADLLAFLGGTLEPLPNREASLPGDPVSGRELFRSKGCAGCHLRGAAGEPVGPDLVSGRWYMTATEIAGAMWNHGPAMWARKTEIGDAPSRFDDDELAHVVAYLYLLRSAGGSGRPERGRELFGEKHCARCHEPGGPGPDLAGSEQLDTPIHFAAEMWNHAPRMQAFLTDAGLSWPVFAASEVTDLVSYLRESRTEKRP